MAPSRDPTSPPVVLIEFSDFECPYCGRFSKETLPILAKEFIETGRVQLVFRHLPLPFHSRGKPSAIAAECAAAQGKFWQMHDLMFQDPKKLGDEDLVAHAAAAGLDLSAFELCVKTDVVATRVAADTEFARSIGLTGTPSFLIGRRTVDGQVAVEVVLSGARPVEDFKVALNRLIDH